jgi:hypothetical protein
MVVVAVLMFLPLTAAVKVEVPVAIVEVVIRARQVQAPGRPVQAMKVYSQLELVEAIVRRP